MDAQVRPELRAQHLLPSAARRRVVDITPLELVLDYLAPLFPTQLHEVYSDEDGHLHARPVFDAPGQPIQSREELERRQRPIEHLAAGLPPRKGGNPPDETALWWGRRH
jgi:hypothetical protein